MDHQHTCALERPAQPSRKGSAGSVDRMKPAHDALPLCALDVGMRASAIVDAVAALSQRSDVHPLEYHANAVADCERHVAMLGELIAVYRSALEQREAS